MKEILRRAEEARTENEVKCLGERRLFNFLENGEAAVSYSPINWGACPSPRPGSSRSHRGVLWGLPTEPRPDTVPAVPGFLLI